MQAPPETALNCQYLLSGPFRRSSKNQSCKALAGRLRVGPKYVLMISNGGYCGKNLASKLARLRANPGSVHDRRNDKPRLYVPFGSREIIAFIETYTTTKQRADCLLALAQAAAQHRPAK